MARPFLVKALEPLPKRLSESLLSFEAASLAVLWNHTCFITEQHVLHVMVHHDSFLRELFCFWKTEL